MYVSTYVCVCVCVCACVHSLSVGDVRPLKQKPSLGFCLAGGFIQLSVLKKGGHPWTFCTLEDATFHLFFTHIIASNLFTDHV